MACRMNIKSSPEIIKTQSCIDDFTDARIALLIATAFGFIVAFAFNDLIVSILRRYFDEESIFVKLIYFLIVFVFAIIAIILLVRYVMPSRACAKLNTSVCK